MGPIRSAFPENMAAAAVTLARRIALSGAPLTAVLSEGLSSRVPCCRSEREHPHGLCPATAPRGVVWCPRVSPRPFSVHNGVHMCPPAGSGSSVSPHGRRQHVRLVARLLVGVRVSRSPPPRVRVSPCQCHVPVPSMSPFCALQCPRIPPHCVTVSPCPPTALVVSLCLSPCLPPPPPVPQVCCFPAAAHRFGAKLPGSLPASFPPSAVPSATTRSWWSWTRVQVQCHITPLSPTVQPWAWRATRAPYVLSSAM